mmetsp:Transcript_96151/g.206290  ORF Transcript_96151/g.206290 Transcript_96151/m.206290 type:complete len:357 (-) Transcript_96151:84-1154(-)
MPHRTKLTVGDLVRVKCDLLSPRFGWGAVRPGDVGTITFVDGRRCRAKFAKDANWRGFLKDMEPVAHEADRALEGVMDMYETLFNTKRFEDVIFLLADGNEGAHKVVLAAASDAFAAMFEQPMQETQSGKVELPSTKWVTMRVFLRLLYTGRVDPQDWQEATTGSEGSPSEGVEPRKGAEPEEEYEDAVDADHSSSDSSSESEEAEGEERNEVAVVGGGSVAAGVLVATVAEPKEKHVGGEQQRAEVPLEILCDVAGLAQKYLVTNVLQLTIEALKVRLQKAAVDKNVGVFEEVLAVAIKMSLGAVRTAAVQVAKKSKAIWKRYDARSLRPEVQLELQAVWAPPRPTSKARHAWLA